MYLSACCLGVATLLHLLSACCLTIALSVVPDQPFRVVWNHPDPCEQKGIDLALAEHGIIHNSDRKFLGDKIQTLYSHGKWPEILKDVMVNGGLPQLWNDTTFAQTKEELMKNFVPNFTGLGVLDWERWRAIFRTNYGDFQHYQSKSLEIVRQRHPDWNKSAVFQLAEQEWEKGARRVMGGKLAVAQELMPTGHWGYYLYPRTWDGDSTVRMNNRLDWLWRQSTGLYPSKYISDASKNPEYMRTTISDTVAEALRVKHEFSSPNTVIYLYIVYNHNATYYDILSYLQLFIGLPADMGADGVVIWGSSAWYRLQAACTTLQGYIREVLGPYVQNLTRVLAECSTALCAGRGRCIHNARDVFVTEDKAVTLSAQCAPRDSRFRDYHCRCYNAGDGDCCQTVKKVTTVTTVTTVSGQTRGGGGRKEADTEADTASDKYPYSMLASILAVTVIAVSAFLFVWLRQGNQIQENEHSSASESSAGSDGESSYIADSSGETLSSESPSSIASSDSSSEESTTQDTVTAVLQS